MSFPVLPFQADELNVPAYLQRYLVEAQRNYLQQQNRQLLHNNYKNDDDNVDDGDIITAADLSSTALPSATTDAPPTTLSEYQASNDLIVPDTGELRQDLTLSVDSVSYVEELGGHVSRNSSSCVGKSFKPSGGGSCSKGNSKQSSKQSSRNNSRQSSRNSRAGKHSSIEDIEAEEEGEEGVEGAEGAAGSQWGGSSSNRSNSFVDRNDNLKKSGLSIIHVGGTTSDPSFEMIVPYDEAFEEVSSPPSSHCFLVVFLFSCVPMTML